MQLTISQELALIFSKAYRQISKASGYFFNPIKT